MKRQVIWLLGCLLCISLIGCKGETAPEKGEAAVVDGGGIRMVASENFLAYLDAEDEVVLLKGDVDLTNLEGKKFVSLADDKETLGALTAEGGYVTSYEYSKEELAALLKGAMEDAYQAGGNYGLGGPDMQVFEELTTLKDVKYLKCSFPYGWDSGYYAISKQGTVITAQGQLEDLSDIKSVVRDNGVFAVAKDGTLIISSISDVTRKKKLNEWTELESIVACAGLVGRRSDGTVVCESPILASRTEGWKDIVELSATSDILVGRRKDGTVVAVSSAVSSAKDARCATDEWTDVIAISNCNTYTAGLKSDYTVVFTE